MIPRPSITDGDSFSPELPLSEDQPDYVYKKALQLKKEGEKFSPEYGSEVNTTLSFLHALDKATEDRHNYLRRRYPEVYGALQLRIDPYDSRDYLLEAGVLGGATPKDLSDCLGMAEETIKEYEEMFFDVRDKMQYPGFIYGRVIWSDGAPEPNPDNISLRTVWRIVGYHLGWHHVLDEISRYSGMIEMVVKQERMKTLVSSLIEDVSPDIILDRNLNSSSNAVTEQSTDEEMSEAQEYYEKMEEAIQGAVKLEPVEINGSMGDEAPEAAQKKLLQAGNNNGSE